VYVVDVLNCVFTNLLNTEHRAEASSVVSICLFLQDLYNNK